MFRFSNWFGYDITCFAGESAPQQAAMRRIVREIFSVVWFDLVNLRRKQNVF